MWVSGSGLVILEWELRAARCFRERFPVLDGPKSGRDGRTAADAGRGRVGGYVLNL
jgi:hypothetical protein